MHQRLGLFYAAWLLYLSTEAAISEAASPHGSAATAPIDSPGRCNGGSESKPPAYSMAGQVRGAAEIGHGGLSINGWAL